MRKLRVGVAGLGRGRLFVDIFQQHPQCEVVAVCDPDASKREAIAGPRRFADYAQFLNAGLDVVAVITPGPLHAEQSVLAMQHGSHVLCETPCVYSLEEARSVIETSRRTGKAFMLAEDYIWMGWAVRAKELAESGLLGEIVYAEGDYTHDCRDIMLADEKGFVPYRERASHPNARRTWRATHLPPLFYTSHTLGPLLHIMDDRIETAIGLQSGTRTAPDLGTTDLESGLFQTEKGAVVRLTNGFTVAHPYALYYNLVGTRGSVKIQRGAGDVFVWYSDAADPPMKGWQPAPSQWFGREDGRPHVAVMVDEFVRAVLSGEAPPVDAYRSMDFVLPGILAHESALRGGVKVDVPDMRKE